MCSCKSLMDVCTLEYWELVPQGIHRLAAVWVDTDERAAPAGDRAARRGAPAEVRATPRARWCFPRFVFSRARILVVFRPVSVCSSRRR